MIIRPRLRSILLVIVICWMVVLTVASLSPVDRFKAGLASYTPKVGVHANNRHRILHWVSFGGLAFVFGILGRNTKQRVLAAVTVAALGLGIEYLQHVIYLNPLETWDIRDDLWACTAGLTSVLLLAAVRRAPKPDALADRP